MAVKESKLYQYEFTAHQEDKVFCVHLYGTKVEWEVMNETFVLFNVFNENNEVVYQYLTDKSASCKVLSSQRLKKATRSGNVVTIEQEEDESNDQNG